MAVLPSTTLTVLTTILGLSTPATFGELSGHGLPPAALHVGALPDPATGLILTTGVPHNDTCPVLNFTWDCWAVDIMGQPLVSEALDV